jgi:hypothetical protein
MKKKLKIKSADLLLLHWPCDVIAANTLKDVWHEMEKLAQEGLVERYVVYYIHIHVVYYMLSLYSCLQTVQHLTFIFVCAPFSSFFFKSRSLQLQRPSARHTTSSLHSSSRGQSSGTTSSLSTMGIGGFLCQK